MAPRAVVVNALDPAAGHCRSTALLETPRHSQACLAQSLVGSFLLSPGSWCAQTFVVPSKSLFTWGFSVLLPDPQAEKPVVGPRTFATVQELLWYNCSPVYGLSDQWLYNGANGDLLQEDLQSSEWLLQEATHCASQVCCSQRPCPQALVSRSLLTHASAGDAQTLKCRFSSVSRGGHWSILLVLVHEFAVQIVLLMTN